MSMHDRYPITGRFSKTIQDFHVLRSGIDKYPIVTIPPLSLLRTNNNEVIRHESELFGLHTIFEEGEAGLTPAAASHTPITVSFMRLKQAIMNVGGDEPRVINESKHVYAHLSPCWWGKNGKRMDLHALSQQSDPTKLAFFDHIVRQFEYGIRTFMDVYDISGGQAYKDIQVYGVFGHGTDDERQGTNRSRGALSLPHGHGNVVYIPFQTIYAEHVKLQSATPIEVAKQIGAMDTLILEDFESDLMHIIRQRIKERFADTVVGSLSTDINHSIRLDGKGVSYHDGIRILLDEEIPAQSAFMILTDIIAHFESLSDIANTLYTDYWTASSRSEKHATIKQMNDALREKGFCKRSSENLTDLIMSLKPTRPQLEQWVQSLKRKKIQETEEEKHTQTIKNLERKADIYTRVDKFLKSGGDKTAKQHLKNFYDLSEQEAEILLTILRDKYRPKSEYKEVKHTMPVHISGSYLFDKYRIDKNQTLKVSEFTIAPKLMTEKGGLEDLAMYIVRRKEGA